MNNRTLGAAPSIFAWIKPAGAPKKPPEAVKPAARSRSAPDFSHLLLNVRRAAKAAAADLPSPVIDLRPTELGASRQKEAAALVMAKQILAAGRKAKMPTGTGAPPPETGSLAAQIIAAGKKRRGLNGSV